MATVEVERFSLVSSRPLDKILAAMKAAIGHPERKKVEENTISTRSSFLLF